MDFWQPSDIKRNLPRRSVANNVEIHIPVPSDVDSPSFKTSIGTVRYIPDQDRKVLCLGLSDETPNSIALGIPACVQDCIVWSIKQFQGCSLGSDRSSSPWYKHHSETKIGMATRSPWLNGLCA